MAVRRRGPKPDAVAVRLQRAGAGLLDSPRTGGIRRLQQHGRCAPVRAVHVVPEASQREYFARSLRAFGQSVRGQIGAGQRGRRESHYQDGLHRVRPRGLELRLPVHYPEHRSRALSAVAAVLLHHPGGVLTMRTRHFAIAAGLVVLAGCNFDILNTNQPTLGDLLSNPTRDKLTAQATGLMSSARNGMESFIWRVGAMGREGINLSGNNQPDYAEPFFGPVQGGGSFGGTQWLDRYQSIRTANIYLQALANNVSLSGPDLLTAEERAASRGLANTYKALAFLYVIETRAQLGAPVDVDRTVDQGPAPWVTEDSVYGYILGLLNSARADLTTADTTHFPFPIPPGLSGFDTPAAFITFNRALAAKANVLRATALNGCGGAPAHRHAAALTHLVQSFLSTTPTGLQSGALLDFSTNGGDQTHGLSQPLHGPTHLAPPPD